MRHAYIYRFLMLLFSAWVLVQCSRADEENDVLSQEDISNIILVVKDELTGVAETYNYTMNAPVQPEIKLKNGRNYIVRAVFLNGNEDETESIIEAKDEHFLLYRFEQSEIELERLDNEESTRSDGARLGLKTRWNTINVANGAKPQLVLTLVHDPMSVSETKDGATYGTVEGGETDALAVFSLKVQL